MPEAFDTTGNPKRGSLPRQEIARQFVDWVRGLRFMKRAPEEPLRVDEKKVFDVWEFAPERPAGARVFPENGEGRNG